jgi:hypothetical protein
MGGCGLSWHESTVSSMMWLAYLQSGRPHAKSEFIDDLDSTCGAENMLLHIVYSYADLYRFPKEIELAVTPTMPIPRYKLRSYASKAQRSDSHLIYTSPSPE